MITYVLRGGGVESPIHFHCVLHAKRGVGGPDCKSAYVLNGRPLGTFTVAPQVSSQFPPTKKPGRPGNHKRIIQTVGYLFFLIIISTVLPLNYVNIR